MIKMTSFVGSGRSCSLTILVRTNFPPCITGKPRHNQWREQIGKKGFYVKIIVSLVMKYPPASKRSLSFIHYWFCRFCTLIMKKILACIDVKTTMRFIRLLLFLLQRSQTCSQGRIYLLEWWKDPFISFVASDDPQYDKVANNKDAPKSFHFPPIFKHSCGAILTSMIAIRLS